jgi:hypothetical protein
MRIRQCLKCRRSIVDTRTYLANSEIRNRYGRHYARGLCQTCYANERYHNRLGDWPALNWQRDELLDDWVLLRESGVPIAQAAERIGINVIALDRALHRATKAGDQRGRHNGCRWLRKPVPQPKAA